MDIFYSEKAVKDLEQCSKDVQQRIADKMRYYAQQEDPMKFAKRLTNVAEGEFRFRIGDYRIIFDVSLNTIFVLRILHRSKAYE